VASDTSLIFNLIAKDKVTKALGPIAAKLSSFGTGIGKAMAGVGVAAPAVAAAMTAASGLAAGATAAGLAVGGFAAAVKPQMASVTDAMALYEATLENTGQTSKAVREEQKKYAASLKEMPKATQGFTKELIGLKKEYQDWSGRLANTTMPVFTKGLEIARGLLPKLTPLVRTAARELGRFLGQISAGTKSKGFAKWLKDMTAAAGPALRSILATVKNLAVGAGALLGAFLPMSTGMTGGLVTMSAAFSRWAQGLEKSTGFARFLDMAQAGKGALGTLGTALLSLAASLAPFAGATAIIAQGLASVIAATPPQVITVLAQAFIAASVGMKAWAIATGIWKGIQATAISLQYAWNAALTANPVGLVIIGIVALIAIVVVCYKKFPAFRAAVQAAMRGAVVAFGWLVEAGKKVWGWIQANWPKIKPWLMVPIKAGIAVATAQIRLVIGAGRAVLGWIRGAWQGAKAMANPIKTAVTTIKTKFRALLGWFRGLPGQFRRVGEGLIQGLRDGIAARWDGVVSWVKGLVDQLPAAAKKALNMASPSKVFHKIGWHVAEGMANGIRGGWKHVVTALERGLKAVQTRYEAAKSRLDATKSNWSQSYAATRDVFRGAGITERGDSALTMAGSLRNQVAQAKTMLATLRRLKAAGLNTTMLSQLAAAGPDALGQAQSILGSGRAGIAEFNQLQGQLGKVSAAAGKFGADTIYGKALREQTREAKSLARVIRELTNAIKLSRRRAKKAGKNALGTSSWAGGPTWVGEDGPEILDLPGGARILSASQSRAAMAPVIIGGGTGTTRVVLEVRGTDRVLLEMLRKAIRVEGGNVQTVLGRAS